MLFFKYFYSHNAEDCFNVEKKKGRYNYSRGLEDIAVSCNEFCEELDNIKFYITQNEEKFLTFIAIFNGNIKDLTNIDRIADDLVLHLNLDMIIFKREEITYANCIRELDTAQDNNFVFNASSVRDFHGLYRLEVRGFMEKRIKCENPSKQELLKKCDDLVLDDELKNEVERIYQPKTDNVFAVPAHYVLNISNEKESEKAVDILINALKINGRIVRNFYTVIDLTLEDNRSNTNMFDLGRIYDLNIGGVVVVKSNFNINDDDFLSHEHMVTEFVSEQILNNASNVTTIVCCKHKSQEILFKNNLRDLLIIDINDITIKNETAKQYLKNYAENLDITNLSGLLEMVEEDFAYKTNDLIKIFNKWHKNYVKTIQYPQYASLVETNVEVEKKEEKNCAYAEINNLVGLKDIKKTIEDYINYAQLQKACLKNGSIAKNTCKHLCFVGNPGTAKTTVARYIAQVMKEQGLLTGGQLIEVGRADIVSKYVGGTAPQVQELFRKAIGNVLFIDEAYSLCDGREGMYGDEAINTIVQEMENKRENMVVIFAGYKKEMSNFLERNSGLKSRIANIVEFPDYTEDELIKIANYQAEKMDVDISKCEEKITEIIALAKSKEKNFGNGRFIRNILEKARMKQASRLVKEDKLFGEYLRILYPEDFEIPIFEEKIKLGFC